MQGSHKSRPFLNNLRSRRGGSFSGTVTLALELLDHLLLEYDELRRRLLRLLSRGFLSLLTLRLVVRRGLRLGLRLTLRSTARFGEGERSASLPFSRASLGSLSSLSDMRQFLDAGTSIKEIVVV